MVQIPKYAALKSKYNNKYLRYVNEKSSPVRTFLQYSGEEILTPYTKLELEQAQSDPSLFHIKCCYNHKYLVSSPSDHHYIIATADQKLEDKSKWTCTLFRPTYDNNHHSFRFSHVFLGLNVVLWRADPPYGECLRAQSSNPATDFCDLNMVMNFESLISLPKFVAFRGDNEHYLRHILMENNLPYLQFGGSFIDDPNIQMETYMTKGGSIRIKSSQSGKFWRHDTSNYILADSTNTNTQSLDTLFSPTKISSTVVALRNLGNGNFVKRYIINNILNFLYAQKPELDSFAHLQMIELVRSREISNVLFQVSDAKIYNQTVVMLANKSATNGTGEPKIVRLNLPYTHTTYSTWTSSISTKLSDVKTRIRSGVPLILDGKTISSTSSFSGEYKWGETITKSETTNGITHEVTVPAMSTITSAFYATKGSCDIPFSYKQYDVLIAGNSIEYFLDDGVYHGTNYYNFKYDIKIVPITPM